MNTQPTKKALTQKNVVVLGASGFIGRWVAKILSQYDLTLHLAVRNPPLFEATRKRWALDGQVHAFDALAEKNQDGLDELLATASPDIVINCVGYGIDRGEKDENLALQLNGNFPKLLADTLLSLSESKPCRLIHLGSALEYGQQTGDLGEESETEPTSLYGRTKLAGTVAVRHAVAKGLDGVVARLFTIYGPGEHSGRLLPLLRCAKLNGTTVDLSDGAQARDFAFVEDVAQAIVALAAKPELQFDVVNLASGELTKVREFILIAARVLQLSSDHLNFGAVPRYADEMQHRPVSIERCRKLLGFPLCGDLEEGLKAAVRFEERAG